MNKKSVGIIEVIIWLGLAAFVGFVLLNFFGKTSKEAGTFFSTETLKAKDSKCLFDMQRALERGQKPTDMDGDGRPDFCDICFSYLNKQGNNNEDNDGDGMPTYCDQDESIDKGRTVVACKSSFTITKDGRCIEGAAPAAKKVG